MHYKIAAKFSTNKPNSQKISHQSPTEYSPTNIKHICVLNHIIIWPSTLTHFIDLSFLFILFSPIEGQLTSLFMGRKTNGGLVISCRDQHCRKRIKFFEFSNLGMVVKACFVIGFWYKYAELKTFFQNLLSF